MSDQDQTPGSCGNTNIQILDNPPQKIKRIETDSPEVGIDRISQLPDDLIVQILSLMPTKDAYYTTILSKRWHNLWTFIDNLVFHYRVTSWDDISDFVSFTDNVMCLLCGSKIKKFSLSFGVRYRDLSYDSKIDEWLTIAVNKEVKELDLDVYYRCGRPYSLPKVLFNGSLIQKINCRNCVIPETLVLNWISLKSLTLHDLFLRDGQIEEITSSCPLLESLILGKFCGFHSLHITSPKCRRLELIDHMSLKHPNGDEDKHSVGGELDCCFRIDAPYVQHLKISGDFAYVDVTLGNFSSLVHADLTYSKSCMNGDLDLTIVKDQLASVCCANELVVPSWFIEGIYVLIWEKKDVSLPLLECTRLTITCWYSKHSFLAIASLLRSTPFLEDLKILPEEGVFINDWAGLLAEYRSLPAGAHDNIFKGCLHNLKSAEVTSAACIDIYGRRADITVPLEFLKSLLEHAVNLEKMVIAPGHGNVRCNICSTNVLKLIKNLLAFPRASKCCKFFGIHFSLRSRSFNLILFVPEDFVQVC